ncbi:Breast cancer anti-estrogen resistance protein 1 [Eufriesea mexicana]|uniref:Breast cancer anti-estrogen resistance protein 1 n=1 Tax=Eufriesea mexicana TaxID=516756 RepID=A0A310SBV3_9HYME|nr:Breast cancer anti-estrogen resistance protein 1 [Eufriesea mexicana]
MLQQKCVKARALYDNIAEAPDELAFRKGDVLTVLEQNTAGLEGWWLCALRGRQGICPGNRLRLLVGQYDTGGCLVGSRPDLTISEDGIQRHGKRRSWHVQPNKTQKIYKVHPCTPPCPIDRPYTRNAAHNGVGGGSIVPAADPIAPPSHPLMSALVRDGSLSKSADYQFVCRVSAIGIA